MLTVLFSEEIWRGRRFAIGVKKSLKNEKNRKAAINFPVVNMIKATKANCQVCIE